MKIIEKLKSKTLDEFAEWLDEHCRFDDVPWINFWHDNYCDKCPTEIGKYEDSKYEIEFAWCELHDKCKFFPGMDDIPDTTQIIKMWLESEA